MKQNLILYIPISDTNIAEEATACGVRPDLKLEAPVSELTRIETGVMNGAEKEQVIIPARKYISQLFLFRQIYNIYNLELLLIIFPIIQIISSFQ